MGPRLHGRSRGHLPARRTPVRYRHRARHRRDDLHGVWCRLPHRRARAPPAGGGDGVRRRDRRGERDDARRSCSRDHRSRRSDVADRSTRRGARCPRRGRGRPVPGNPRRPGLRPTRHPAGDPGRGGTRSGCESRLPPRRGPPGRTRPHLRHLAVPHPDRRAGRPRPRRARHHDRLRPPLDPTRRRQVGGASRRGVRGMEAGLRGAGRMRERRRQVGRPGDARQRVLPGVRRRRRRASRCRGLPGGSGALVPARSRVLRARSRHVRVELPRRPHVCRLPGRVGRVRTSRVAPRPGRAGRIVRRDRPSTAFDNRRGDRGPGPSRDERQGMRSSLGPDTFGASLIDFGSPSPSAVALVGAGVLLKKSRTNSVVSMFGVGDRRRREVEGLDELLLAGRHVGRSGRVDLRAGPGVSAVDHRGERDVGAVGAVGPGAEFDVRERSLDGGFSLTACGDGQGVHAVLDAGHLVVLAHDQTSAVGDEWVGVAVDGHRRNRPARTAVAHQVHPGDGRRAANRVSSPQIRAMVMPAPLDIPVTNQRSGSRHSSSPSELSRASRKPRSSTGSKPGRTAAGSRFQNVVVIVPVVSGTSTGRAWGVTTTNPRSPAASGMSVSADCWVALEEKPWRFRINGAGVEPS